MEIIETTMMDLMTVILNPKHQKFNRIEYVNVLVDLLVHYETHLNNGGKTNPNPPYSRKKEEEKKSQPYL
jgi:hypothetical protein